MRELVVTAMVLSAVLLPAQASADPGHKKPRITVMRWEDPPVTTTEEDCETDCHEESLIVEAHDRDSSITEVQVRAGGGGITFAHTYCVQGKRAGAPVRLKIPVTFTEDGTYDVQAVAYSHRRCARHAAGDDHLEQHSKVVHLETSVEGGAGEGLLELHE